MAISQTLDDNDIKDVEIRNRDEIMNNQQFQIKYLREDLERERKLRKCREEELDKARQTSAVFAVVSLLISASSVFY